MTNRTRLVALLALTSVAVQAADFRIYTANKLLQQRRAFSFSDADKPGCHNLPFGQRVYRVAQIGFERCFIYAEKDCKPGNELKVSWKNEREPALEITPGARWYLEGERGSKMGSWKCEPREERRRRSERNR